MPYETQHQPVEDRYPTIDEHILQVVERSRPLTEPKANEPSWRNSAIAALYLELPELFVLRRIQIAEWDETGITFSEIRAETKAADEWMDAELASIVDATIEKLRTHAESV